MKSMAEIKPMYKYGDRVTIKSDLELNEKYGGTNFNSHMYQNAGRNFYIERVIVNGHKSTGGRIQEGYVLRGVGYTYTKEMFVQTDVEQLEVGMEVEIIDADIEARQKPYNYKNRIGEIVTIREKRCINGYWRYTVKFENEYEYTYPKEMLVEINQEPWVVTWQEEICGKAFAVVKSRRQICKGERSKSHLVASLNVQRNAINIKSEILNKEV